MKIVKFNEEEFEPLNKKIKEGNWYRIHGNMEMDAYLKQ